MNGDVQRLLFTAARHFVYTAMSLLTETQLLVKESDHILNLTRGILLRGIKMVNSVISFSVCY